MRKFFLISILVSGLSFGQIFNQSHENIDNESNFFKQKEQGTVRGQLGDNGDEPSNPSNPGDPTPIDNWVFLLPVIAVGVGFRYLYYKRKELVN